MRSEPRCVRKWRSAGYRRGGRWGGSKRGDHRRTWLTHAQGGVFVDGRVPLWGHHELRRPVSKLDEKPVRGDKGERHGLKNNRHVNTLFYSTKKVAAITFTPRRFCSASSNSRFNPGGTPFHQTTPLFSITTYESLMPAVTWRTPFAASRSRS